MPSERITDRMLNALCERINEATGSPAVSYTRDESGTRANIGHYHADRSYGGVSLDRMFSEGGGVENIIPRGTKRELYHAMRAYLDGIEAGKAYGAPANDGAVAALERAFGREWRALDPYGRAAVLVDFCDTSTEPDLSAEEYRDRIGAGNLASYADVMRTRFGFPRPRD